MNERQPIEIPIGLDVYDGRHRLVRATWWFVALGVVLRVVTYGMKFPLWGDEAFVAANFIGRGYLDLLRPLDYGQICPLFFLWVDLTAVKLFGFHEWSLRLFPTVCSVASVFLFAHVSGRVARGPARLLAVAAFCVAFYAIRHGAEVKPYSSDLLVALILQAMAIEWWRAPERSGWLWALTAVVPLALGFSHPAVFVAGGVSLGLAGMAWKSRRTGALVPFVAYNLTMVAAFLVLFAVFTRGQERATLATLRTHYWAGAFPPLRSPWKLARWMAEAHTGRMFAYPFGDARGGSSFTTLCFVAGLVVLWRRRETALVVLVLGPFGLSFVAAVMGRYPYGGSARTMIFVAPSICLLTGLGLTSLITRLRRRPFRLWAFRGAAAGLAGAGLVVLGLNVAYPYKTVADRNSRDFARWFWTEKARDAHLACVKSDLGAQFNRRNWKLFRSALYLCNQKIYSTHRRLGVGADTVALSGDLPLRCVLYNEWPEKDRACALWVEAMLERHELRNRETFLINEPSQRDDGTDVEDRYTVLDFVPRESSPPRVSAHGEHPQPSRMR